MMDKKNIILDLLAHHFHLCHIFVEWSNPPTDPALKSHPHGPPGRWAPRNFTNSLWRNFFLCGGLGKFGVSSQGMWAKSMKSLKMGVTSRRFGHFGVLLFGEKSPIMWNVMRYPLGCSPSQDSSHHQDYEPFLVGDPYKPSFATVTGRGDNPRYPFIFDQQPSVGFIEFKLFTLPKV